MARTPADGLIGGLAQVNRGPDRRGRGTSRDPSRCAVLSYDYMVLAGTQGTMGHRKKDRLFDVIERLRLPTVFFAEGGGGRPGDTDYPIVSALDVPTFAAWGRLSGLVPRIGVVGGRCFAGNAAIFGCSDITIATADSSIGMGGPAMIEGGGLGVVAPGRGRSGRGAGGERRHRRAWSTTTRQAVRVRQAGAVVLPGAGPTWDCADQRRLRTSMPENRLRVYDVREVIATLADTDSVLELRAALRARHGHRARAHRGSADRHRREQPGAPRRRHHQRERRQGGSVPAALRRLRPAGPVPLRHPGDHGRAGRGGDRAGAAREPAVRHRRAA